MKLTLAGTNRKTKTVYTFYYSVRGCGFQDRHYREYTVATQFVVTMTCIITITLQQLLSLPYKKMSFSVH